LHAINNAVAYGSSVSWTWWQTALLGIAALAAIALILWPVWRTWRPVPA